MVQSLAKLEKWIFAACCAARQGSPVSGFPARIIDNPYSYNGGEHPSGPACQFGINPNTIVRRKRRMAIGRVSGKGGCRHAE